MTEETVYIKNDTGVHARPAMMLVREAMKYHKCEISLIKYNNKANETEANCKSIMSVLGLGITPGSKIIVRAVGNMEEVAVQKLVSLITNNFQDE